MTNAIDIQNLSKSFATVAAVQELTMTVPRGSIFGLIGPNGAGKSSLIRMLMGIYRPDSGDAYLLGRSIREKSGHIRQKVAYVPDVPHMYPSFLVNEMFLLASKLYVGWDWERCKRLSQAFSIPLNQRIRNLSRGVKVQAALIMALSTRPDLIILDEPTGGLDPVIRKDFLYTIVDEVAAYGTTVFYSTHNISDLEQSADHIAALYQGRLLFTSSVDELKESVHCFHIIASDYVLGQIRELPGLLGWQKSGKSGVVTMHGPREEILNQIQSFNPEHIEPRNISLEDIFITLLRKAGYLGGYAETGGIRYE